MIWRWCENQRASEHKYSDPYIAIRNYLEHLFADFSRIDAELYPQWHQHDTFLDTNIWFEGIDDRKCGVTSKP